MSISSSKPDDQSPAIPFDTFAYRDICAPPAPPKETKPVEAPVEEESVPQAPPGPTPEEINDMVNRARQEAVAETERRLKAEYEKKSAAEVTKIREALEAFQTERKRYFLRVESDVVQLSLAIAAKILHREAQVDPLLLAALVRVAIDRLHDGSKVLVRVSPTTAQKWRTHVSNPLNNPNITIAEDPQLSSEDCILETDLGSANFSIDGQMKEIEQGFFDLLAQRPAVK